MKIIRNIVYALPRPRATPDPLAIPLTGLRVDVVVEVLPRFAAILDVLELVPE